MSAWVDVKIRENDGLYPAQIRVESVSVVTNLAPGVLKVECPHFIFQVEMIKNGDGSFDRASLRAWEKAVADAEWNDRTTNYRAKREAELPLVPLLPRGAP